MICAMRIVQIQDNSNGVNKLGKANSMPFHLSLGDYLSASTNQCKILSFGTDSATPDKRDFDDLIIASDSEGNIKTGNYIGVVRTGKEVFNITSRFGDALLRRMLNVADNVFLQDVNALPQVKDDIKNTSNIAKYMLQYLFVQRLERAYLLGFPKEYVNVRKTASTLRGRLDIPHYVRTAIPYTGRLPSVRREFAEVRPIASVIWRALQVIGNSSAKPKGGAANRNTNAPAVNLLHNIRQVVDHVREINAGVVWSPTDLSLARHHKALHNPIYAPYRSVLEYAEWVIQSETLKAHVQGSNRPHTELLVNVAELFEVYVRKLLQRHFPGWSVTSPALELHEGCFFQRKFIPDIVLERGNDIAVFDTKYKRMKFVGRSHRGAGDLDRADFFQITSYMAYYARQPGKRLIAGGLLYPIETAEPSPNEKGKGINAAWLDGGVGVRFGVDGIYVPSDENVSDEKIANAESEFVKRMRDVLEPRVTLPGSC